MSWKTSCCRSGLWSSHGSRVLCSTELMSENWAGRSCAVPVGSAVRGARWPNWAGPGDGSRFQQCPRSLPAVAGCPDRITVTRFALLVANRGDARCCLIVPALEILFEKRKRIVRKQGNCQIA